MASPTVIAESGEILLADLVAGYTFPLEFFPSNTEQFIDLNYDVTGTNPTTGQISAFLVWDVQSNK